MAPPFAACAITRAIQVHSMRTASGRRKCSRKSKRRSPTCGEQIGLVCVQSSRPTYPSRLRRHAIDNMLIMQQIEHALDLFDGIECDLFPAERNAPEINESSHST